MLRTREAGKLSNSAVGRIYGISRERVRQLIGSPPPPNALDHSAHFWERVDMSGGPDACWPWTGARHPSGYGGVSWRGGRVNAHRVAYELAYGNPGKGFVCHHCDNPPCCNPAHLFLGTAQDNYRDSIAKGHSRQRAVDRTPIKGLRHGRASSYINYGCRCVACKDAFVKSNEKYVRRLRARIRQDKNMCGTNAKYQLGCRCVSCRAAGSEHSRKAYATRRVRAVA